jgi:hypothetical protein
MLFKNRKMGGFIFGSFALRDIPQDALDCGNKAFCLYATS